MNQKLYEQLCEQLGKKNVLCGEPMSRHTTFRTGGPAELFLTPDAEHLSETVHLLKDASVPYLVIGNGSNLLVGDRGIKGAVIEIGRQMSDITVEGERMRIQAGALLSAAASRAANESLTGMEFASGIPGSLGGAAVMNAGAYGGEMKDILESVTVLNARGEMLVLNKEQLDLSYRHSCIPEKGYIVTEAVLHLRRGVHDEILSVMKDLKNRRVSKQPLEYPSAGSTFKRPEGYFAGKLIEEAGLRGYRVGGAQVSEKHCGFVINRDGATSAQIRQLMEDVQRRVYETAGVKLEPEVKFIGDF